MLNEERDLLIKEVCARIPYDVKCKFEDKVYDILGFAHGRVLLCLPFMSNTITTPIENIELYLLPLSSMTEEQFEELKVFADLTYEGNTLELVEWNVNCKTLEFWLEEIPSYCVIKVFDWLNKNHFDYRGFIDREIVKDATNLNIY